jgi:hypothetical protein
LPVKTPSHRRPAPTRPQRFADLRGEPAAEDQWDGGHGLSPTRAVGSTQLIMPVYRQASFEASAGQFAGKTDLRRVSPELGARYT